MGIVTVVAIFMVAATLLWNEVGWISTADSQAARAFSMVRDLTGIGAPDTSYAEEFVFVDVSGALRLRPRSDHPEAVEVVTDREKLGRLLELLSRHPTSYRFIVCDVLLDAETEQDSLLRRVLPALPRFLAASTVEVEGEKRVLRQPIFGVEHGVAQVQTSRDLAVRMRKRYVVGDTVYDSLPLKLHDALHGAERPNRWQLPLHTFYVDPLLRPAVGGRVLRSVDSGETVTPEGARGMGTYYMPIEDLLFLTQVDSSAQGALADEFFGDKIVVVGDFAERDLHRTVLGDIPGPLLLVNGYLSLREGAGGLPLPLLAFLFGVFWAIAFFIAESVRDSRGDSLGTESPPTEQGGETRGLHAWMIERVPIWCAVGLLCAAEVVAFVTSHVHVPVLMWTILIVLVVENREAIARGISRVRGESDARAPGAAAVE